MMRKKSMAEENKKPFLDLPVYIGLHKTKQSMLRKKGPGSANANFLFLKKRKQAPCK